MNTSPPNVSQANTIYHQPHYEDGQTMEKLNVFDQTPSQELEVDKDCITHQILTKCLDNQIKNSLTLELQSVMQESVVTTKKKISKDKSKCLKTTTQKPKSSKILLPELIGKDQVLEPFWNPSTLEMSKKLWSPTRTECVDLDSNSWTGSSKKTMLNSWFSTRLMKSKTWQENCQMISLQSQPFLSLKTTDYVQPITENKKKSKKISEPKNKPSPENNKSKKISEPKSKPNCAQTIKIYPNKEQKQTLNQWIGARRWVYNKCVWLTQVQKEACTKKNLRSLCVNESCFETENTWMSKIPYEIRDCGLTDFFKNLDSNMKKFKIDNKPFKLCYIKKKDRESIYVRHKDWGRTRGMYSNTFTQNLKSSESLPEKLMYDSRLTKNQLNEFYIHIPTTVICKERENQASQIIALDPGIKTFVTGYDPSGYAMEWSEPKRNNGFGRVSRLLHGYKRLRSERDKEKSLYKKKRKTTCLFRVYKKIQNLITELHKKLALWLCQNYKVILLPKLNFHKIKKLNKRDKTKAAIYSHCAFFKRLEEKAREYPETTVIQVNESYTSMTCSECGNLHLNLKNKDTYSCQNCKVVLGRDLNAAKNIYMRYVQKELGR